ncbi:glycosyltransferase family 4 protein [Bacillus tianshenii]|uniref:glycosyltransferase family 4 protein n=1 Tax=Sutcliffiella tianshenii TaxID=1463404 RepID=UPI001CD54450|nr:glycosyltransferase family 4 protein [Bacillus tianshenii]MCA1321851.1 glycosyltransferase family 4 protein [Bacillus tianshenii]
MNVLVITDKLITGGAENYFCKLENEMRHPSISFHYAAAPGELLRNLKNLEGFTELKRDRHLFNFLQIRKIILEQEIDIVHANSLRMVLLATVLRRSIRRRFKIIYTKHNVTKLETNFPAWFAGILNRSVAKIITVSDFEKYELMKKGVRAENISTIHNGVDLKQFAFQKKRSNGNFKIGILARISEEKNHSFFIDIANQCKGIEDFQFFIAGDGPDQENVKSLITSLGLSEKVIMLGTVREPEKFLKEMDVLLLTSNREVFPMVILEAMAVGTPVISIDRGGIGEAIINGETGFLISDHISNLFLESIMELKRNEFKRLSMIYSARKKVEKSFSLQQMIKRTLGEYRNQSINLEKDSLKYQKKQFDRQARLEVSKHDGNG